MQITSLRSSLVFIFLFSFLTNLIWENIHSLLYLSYKERPLTEWILLRATLVDAVIISLVAIPFIISPRLKKMQILSIIVFFVISISIEKWALSTERWNYRTNMPIIPIINTGITPTIQLPLLGLLAIYVNKKRLDVTEKNEDHKSQ